MCHDATRCVARIPDAADLAALDAALSPPHLPGLTEDEIRSRLQRFPTEQLVLCTLSGDIVGALYTRRVGSTAAIVKGESSTSHAFTLHDANGPVRMLLALQLARTESTLSGLRGILIDCMLTSALARPGVQKVVALVRCQSWVQAARDEPTLTTPQYIQRGKDPGLVLHTARGAKVIAIIGDAGSDGVNVLVEYDLEVQRRVQCQEWQQQGSAGSGRLAPNAAAHLCNRRFVSPQDKRMAAQERIRQDVEKAVRSVLQHDVDFDEPLMEAGLDSYRMKSFVQVMCRVGKCLTHAPAGG